MNSRMLALAIFLLVVIMAIPVMTVLRPDRGPAETVDVAELTLGERRRIEVVAARAPQQLVGLYYQVFVDDRATVEVMSQRANGYAFFGSVRMRQAAPELVVHQSPDGELVALAAAERPGDVLIVHNFATGESWPAHTGGEDVEQLHARGERMLDALRATLPDADLRLLRGEGLRVLPVARVDDAGK